MARQTRAGILVRRATVCDQPDSGIRRPAWIPTDDQIRDQPRAVGQIEWSEERDSLGSLQGNRRGFKHPDTGEEILLFAATPAR